MNNFKPDFQILSGHNKPVYALSESQEQDVFFSAGEDRLIAAWNRKNLEAGALATSESSIYALKFNPASNYLYAGTAAGQLLTIDLNEKKIVSALSLHQKGIFFIELLQNGKLITASADGTVACINPESKGLFWQCALGHEKIRQAIPDSSGKLIASCSFTGTLIILDAENGAILRELKVSPQPLHAALWNDEGNHILTGGRDGHLYLVDTIENKCIGAIPAHNYAIYRIIRHPHAPYIATAGRDAAVKLWRMRPLEPFAKVQASKSGQGHRFSVNALIFSPDGKYLISGGDDRNIGIWNIQDLI